MSKTYFSACCLARLREKMQADGLMYLYGVDMRESPDEYLHTAQDIRTAMWQIQT